MSTETEAFVRREMLAFLSSFHAWRSASSNQWLLSSVNFFAQTLPAELDWECQLTCVDYLAGVVRSCTVDLDSYVRRPRDVDAAPDSTAVASCTQQASRQIDSAPPVEVVFVYSDLLPVLLRMLDAGDYHDRGVLGAVARLVLSIKSNDVLVAQLRLGPLDALCVDRLERVVAEAQISTDLYSTQSSAILDDIISAYQFDLDDEKAIDCY